MDVRRVSLPSGGWWAYRTRPTWQDVSVIDSDCERGLERLLVALTEGWAFEDEVCLESLKRRDDKDMAAILQAVLEDVLPWLDQDSPEALAKNLFACMMAGQVPHQFFDVQIMVATGWNWQDLQKTPADVVLKTALFLEVLEAKERGGSLQFPADSSSLEFAVEDTTADGDGPDDK